MSLRTGWQKGLESCGYLTGRSGSLQAVSGITDHLLFPGSPELGNWEVFKDSTVPAASEKISKDSGLSSGRLNTAFGWESTHWRTEYRDLTKLRHF